MTTQSSIFIKLSIVFLMFSMFGCSKDSSTPLSPSSQTTQPTGTITGVIENRVTNEAVVSAKVSLGYNGAVRTTTTSDNSGAFSFADVPAGQYRLVNGVYIFTGYYTLTVYLGSYNSSQTDTNKMYRSYYYSTDTITFISLDSANDKVGMEGSVLLQISYLNTTVKGQVVDQDMQPVSNALVTLYDETVVPHVAYKQTTTAADGSYQFTHVDNGLKVSIDAVVEEGSLTLKGSLAPWTLPANVNAVTDSLLSSVSTQQLMVRPVDDVKPYVINITPENNSDVSPTNLQIVYTFSEPIKQTAYTNTNLPLGDSTMMDDIALNFNGFKKTTNGMNFSAQWNSSFSQLTIIPLGIVGSARYSIDMTKVFKSGKITNLAGDTLMNNQKVTGITGDFEALNFTTEGGALGPAAPVVTRRIVPGQFGYLDYNGGTVALEWNYDRNARSYNIYKSIDGGSSQLLQTNYQGVLFQDNSGSLVVPLGANDPLSAGSVSYIVRAVSKDLVEGTSSTVTTVTDNISPRLINVTVAPAGGAYDWIYTLQFSEPLAVSAAEVASNYSILNPDTVSFNIKEADYLGYNVGSNRYNVQLLITTDLPQPAGYSLQVSSTAVTDLAGNPVDPAADVFTFSPPPVPILSGPNDGSTGVGLPIALAWKTANGATSYHLQVSTVNTFATTVVDNSGITVTTYDAGAPALTTGTLYYWRLSATNAAGTTAYSAVRRFTP